MRLFLAVFPPPETQEAAHAVIEALRRPGDGVSWVKRENLHYTLRFLGEVGEDGARRAAEAAAESASRHAAFDATLGRLGAFPNAPRARVIWIGLERGAEPLEALARSLEEALRAKGFDRAERPFKAHLTIGRVRQPNADWSGKLAAAGLTGALGFRVASLRVVESQLSPQGSRYTVRAEGRLGP
jgi:2'-5' RNA ligase